MEENMEAVSCQVEALHVKTEMAGEDALTPSSRESHAACGENGGGGGDLHLNQAEEIMESDLTATTTAPVLLYPVNTDRLFSTTADEKTYLKIAPASGNNFTPAEKIVNNTFTSGFEFTSKAVFCLIDAVGRRWYRYETRERSQLFQSVQEEMACKGHTIPVDKIRRKWNNLIVTYKRVKDRSRETGQAKTSWEFFDAMDATLGDTIGAIIMNNNKREPYPKTKMMLKVTQQNTTNDVVRPSTDAVSQFNTATTTITSASTSTFTSNPLIILKTNPVKATVVPSQSFINSPALKEVTTLSPSTGSTSYADLNTLRLLTRKSPTIASGVLPLHLGSNQKLITLPTFKPTSPRLTSSSFTSPAEENKTKSDEDRCSNVMLQEVLKRQREQTNLERVSQRMREAGEKRRERREVQMAASLSRIATTMELLTSKQDTVIALLQRIADRKC